MTLSEKTTNSPAFFRMNAIANEHVIEAVTFAGFTLRELSEFDVHAGRVVDQLTTLLMRMAVKKGA